VKSTVSGRKIGYCRTSTTGQETALQLDALTREGCERVFEETVSGAAADRPVLAEVLADLAPGDTLVVWRLDRLGRSAQHLLAVLEQLRERGVAFRSITEGMDTSTYMGRFVFTILGAVAEMEREIIRERVNAGLAAARQRGRVGGRPPVVTPERMRLATRLRYLRSLRRVRHVRYVAVSSRFSKVSMGSVRHVGHVDEEAFRPKRFVDL